MIVIMIVIGAVAVAGIAAALGFYFGVFRIESVDNTPAKQSAQGDDPGDSPPGMNFGEDKKPGDSEREPQDLFDFSEEEQVNGEEDKKQKLQAQEDSASQEFDKLCDLKTGRGYLVDAQKALNAAMEDDRMLALAYFDYDRFRFINSLKGVSIGDFAISRMAQEMKAVFPEDSLCTRVSADHFAVLFPLVDEGMIADYAEKIKRIADRIRNDIAVKSGLRVSMGVAIPREAPKDYNIGVLMAQANVARHCLKTAKSEAVNIYDSSMAETFLFGESALEDFGDNQYSDEFVLYFQPLFDLKRSRIIGCQSLVRWTVEDEVSKFTSLNSDNGRLPTNNTKIIYHVCRWLGRWRKAGKDITMSFAYLSATDLFKEDIDEYLARSLSAFQVEPHTLAIEIDINVIRMAWSVASRQIKKLKEVGVQVCVTGIDRGYTGLDQVAGLPVDLVKFHRSFAKGLAQGHERLAEVKSMIAAAADLNAKTLFDGVDSREQADALKLAGADIVQGEYAGKVGDPETVSKSLGEFIESQKGAATTTILDDEALAKGNFNMF